MLAQPFLPPENCRITIIANIMVKNRNLLNVLMFNFAFGIEMHMSQFKTRIQMLSNIKKMRKSIKSSTTIDYIQAFYELGTIHIICIRILYIKLHIRGQPC